MSSSFKAKQALRKQIRESLNALSQVEILEHSAKVFENVFSLPQYKSASSIGLFLSMPKGEIMTEDACRRIINDGKDLYVPRVGIDFEQLDMEMVKVPCQSLQDDEIFYDMWPRNKWGIPEAPRTEEFIVASPGDIDILLVPGLGFDRKGGRLGQGKGYYDRFIEKMRSGGRLTPILMAVGLTPSLIEDGIPMMEHDIFMNSLILPDEILHFS
jgi:5-formyltetrahydrofolate cyclo-ligase